MKKSYLTNLFVKFCPTVTCMVSFGDSKHEPVKPLQSLLDVTLLKLALSAKCTIHDVVFSCFILSVSPCVGEACSLSKFGRAVDMCVCLMCMALCEGF